MLNFSSKAMSLVNPRVTIGSKGQDGGWGSRGWGVEFIVWTTNESHYRNLKVFTENKSNVVKVNWDKYEFVLDVVKSYVIYYNFRKF